MAEDRFIRFQLPDETGKMVWIKMYTPHLHQFLTQMLGHISTWPTPAALTQEVAAEPDPIHLSFFGVSPIEGTDLARVSIAVGPIVLQLAVSLAVLFQTLDALNQTTEPDPTSSHRPH